MKELITNTENTHLLGKDHSMPGLQFKQAGSDKKEIMLLFVCSEAV